MKLVSILGDSVSTYLGYNPEGYAVYYDEEMRLQNGLNSVNDTWWVQVIQALNARLCVNGSYSGSQVTGNIFPAALSDERIADLRTSDAVPNVILVYIGFNDFGRGIKASDKGLKRILYHDGRNFANDYMKMLAKIKRAYPKALIVCGTLMRTEIRGRPSWRFPEMFAGTRFEDYNTAIRRACKRKNCRLADLNALGAQYETLDGSPPTAKGHKTIADAWIKCFGERII